MPVQTRSASSKPSAVPETEQISETEHSIGTSELLGSRKRRAPTVDLEDSHDPEASDGNNDSEATTEPDESIVGRFEEGSFNSYIRSRVSIEDHLETLVDAHPRAILSELHHHYGDDAIHDAAVDETDTEAPVGVGRVFYHPPRASTQSNEPDRLPPLLEPTSIRHRHQNRHRSTTNIPSPKRARRGNQQPASEHLLQLDPGLRSNPLDLERRSRRLGPRDIDPRLSMDLDDLRRRLGMRGVRRDRIGGSTRRSTTEEPPFKIWEDKPE